MKDFKNFQINLEQVNQTVGGDGNFSFPNFTPAINNWAQNNWQGPNWSQNNWQDFNFPQLPQIQNFLEENGVLIVQPVELSYDFMTYQLP